MKVFEDGHARALRTRTIEIFTGQRPARQRRPGKEKNIVIRFRARLGDLGVVLPVQQTERVLNRHRSFHPEFIRRAHEFAHSKRALVGQTVILNLPRRDEFSQRLDGFFNRDGVRALLARHVLGRTRERTDRKIPIRPVHLIQIDVRRL